MMFMYPCGVIFMHGLYLKSKIAVCISGEQCKVKFYPVTEHIVK